MCGCPPRAALRRACNPLTVRGSAICRISSCKTWHIRKQKMAFRTLKGRLLENVWKIHEQRFAPCRKEKAHAATAQAPSVYQ